MPGEYRWFVFMDAGDELPTSPRLTPKQVNYMIDLALGKCRGPYVWSYCPHVAFGVYFVRWLCDLIDLMFGIVGFSIEACVCLFWALISFDFSILRAAIMSASNLHFSYPYPIPWLFPGSPLRTLSIVLSELLSGYNSDLKACMLHVCIHIVLCSKSFGK